MMSTNIQTLTTQIDALFAAWDKPDSPGCALAIIHNGEINARSTLRVECQ